MYEVSKYPHGIFSWVDLSSPNQAEAKAFYSALFGWTARDVPIDGGGVYTMLEIDGKSVAGLGEHQPEMIAQGVPAFWMSYVNADDVDAIAARIPAAGGTLMMPPMDVMDQGRMLLAVDPAGASFGVWEARQHTGAQLVNGPNMLVWNELQTRDPEAARDFYAQVFGWTATTDENNYTLFWVDGRRHAGMIVMDENWGAEVPNNWAVYFRVPQIDAAVARAQEVGGTLVVPPMPAGGWGTFAVIADPHGGVFTIMAMTDEFVDPAP